MRYRIKEQVFLNWPIFHIASSFDDEAFWGADWEDDDVYHFSENEDALILSMSSYSDGTDEDNLSLSLFSDTIPLSAPGNYEPEIAASKLIFEGSIRTDNGSLGYEDRREINAGAELVELKIYRAAEKELTILMEAVGDGL